MIHSSNRRKFIVILCLLITGLLLIVVFTAKTSEKTAEEPYQEFRDILGENVYGYQLGFANPSYGPLGEKLIWNSENDKLELSFTNASTDGEFLLKILWNFEEIEFSVDNGKASRQYIFTSDYSKTMDWKISFPDDLSTSSEDYLGNLTAIVFIEPNIHQKDAVVYEHKNYGLAAVHHVFTSEKFDSFNSNHLFRNTNYQQFEEYEGEFNDLNVTTVEDDLLSNPSPSLQVGSGEMVKLNFLAGASIEDINEYILVALLGNNQVDLNGQRYLPIQLTTNPASGQIIPQTGTVNFQAPSEPGNYEFIMYQFPVEREILGLSLVENSFRLTIVVE